MYRNTQDKTECMGCGACIDICPKECISFCSDGEGFRYPKIDEKKCIHCNLCERVCPIQYPETPHIKVQAKVGVHRSEEVVYNSSSGGAFTAIYTHLIKAGFRVYGAKYTEHLRVVHDAADTEEECELFRKSKYVLSDYNSCYRKIEGDLNDGKKVLFTGTPCQCAALRNYLAVKKCKTDFLIVLDIICHGAPNQEIFDSYIAEAEAEAEAEVYSFRFKNKEPLDGRVNSRSAYISFSSGKKRVVDMNNDPFLKGYYTRLFYRPSCGKCQFARPERVSDITLGDAWGIEKIRNEYDPLKGVSLILANSEAGIELLQALDKDMELFEVPYEWAVSANAQLNHPTEMHKNRKVFFRLWKKKGFRYSVRKATNRSLIAKIRSKAARIIRGR